MIDLCFIEGNPAGVKYILEKKGIGKDYVRLPLVPVSPKTKEAIDAEMQLLG
ncbi:dihydrodipicolinate synthase [Mycobacterium tuberculosis]|nr:dihydrodipicolinate synthase [Mycobacterium tuberculosis]